MRKCALLLCLAFLAGCATPYGALGITGGFDQKELETGVWRLVYAGNGYTSGETVQTYWLYRAAELTLENGFDGFEVLSQIQFAAPAMPRAAHQVAAAHTIFIPIYTDYDSHKPVLVADIRLLKRPFTPDPPKIFDALELKNTLSEYVIGEKCNLGNVCAHVHRYLFAKGHLDDPSGASPRVTPPQTVELQSATPPAPPLVMPPTPAPVMATPPAPAPAAAASPVAVPPSAPSAPPVAVEATNVPPAKPIPEPERSKSAAPASVVVTAVDAQSQRMAAPNEPAINPVSFRCPDAGTTIRTSSQDVLKFAGGSGLRCGYTDEAGNARERYAIFVDGFGRLAKADLDRLWPLKVGNRIEFQVIQTGSTQPTDRAAERNYQESFVVMREENVAVPAGHFASFVIEWHEQGLTSHNKSDAVVDFWYAPQVGYIVKSAVKHRWVSPTDFWGASSYEGLTWEAAEISNPSGKPAGANGAPPILDLPTTPAAATSANPETGGNSIANRLRLLQDLLDQKLITHQEYETRRKVILDSL